MHGRMSLALGTLMNGFNTVDLYLMHWPLAFKRTEDYQELTGEDGKVRTWAYLLLSTFE